MEPESYLLDSQSSISQHGPWVIYTSITRDICVKCRIRGKGPGVGTLYKVPRRFLHSLKSENAVAAHQVGAQPLFNRKGNIPFNSLTHLTWKTIMKGKKSADLPSGPGGPREMWDEDGRGVLMPILQQMCLRKSVWLRALKIPPLNLGAQNISWCFYQKAAFQKF